MSDSSTKLWEPARREFLASLTALGVSGTLLPGVLWANVVAAQDAAAITVATIAEAEKLA